MKRNDRLSNSLKVHRAIKDVTQADLADAIGVSRKTINSIEGGDYQPSVLLALQLARFFEVPVDEIFRIEEIESWSKP